MTMLTNEDVTRLRNSFIDLRKDVVNTTNLALLQGLITQATYELIVSQLNTMDSSDRQLAKALREALESVEPN